MSSDNHASKHIAKFLSDTTRSAFATKPQNDKDKEKRKPDNKAEEDGTDFQSRLHSALQAHHRATFHPENDTLSKAERTSRVMVDAQRPDNPKSN